MTEPETYINTLKTLGCKIYSLYNHFQVHKSIPKHQIEEQNKSIDILNYNKEISRSRLALGNMIKVKSWKIIIKNKKKRERERGLNLNSLLPSSFNLEGAKDKIIDFWLSSGRQRLKSGWQKLNLGKINATFWTKITNNLPKRKKSGGQLPPLGLMWLCPCQ